MNANRSIRNSSRSGESAQNDESLGAWIYFETNEPIGRSYAQNTELIRMSILGKTSVDVVAIEVNPRMRIKIAATIKVYGRFRASFTIHILRLHPKQAFLRFKRPVVKECSRRHGRANSNRT